MRRAVRAATCGLAVAALAPWAGACGARAVEVSTGAEPAAAPLSLDFANNLAQAVNVYVRIPGGSETFLRQVPARSTEQVTVRGVREGASVQLRIAPVDGSQGYVRDNVVIGRATPVRVP